MEFSWGMGLLSWRRWVFIVNVKWKNKGAYYRCVAALVNCKGGFTLATESEPQGALRSSVNQKEESLAESEARRNRSQSSDSVASVVPIHTRSELSSDCDSAYGSASVASVNQPLLLYCCGSYYCFRARGIVFVVYPSHLYETLWEVLHDPRNQV